MIILEVEPPRDNGGKEVTGYRVLFGRKITDYAVGSSAGTIIFCRVTQKGGGRLDSSKVR